MKTKYKGLRPNRVGGLKIAMWLCAMLVNISSVMFADITSVQSITAKQRYPWNGMVDIEVAFTSSSNECENSFCRLTAKDGATGESICIKNVSSHGQKLALRS